MCRDTHWLKEQHRGVVFVDPFALHVEWDTLRAVAATKALDLWLLFPVMAVQRLLPRNGVVDEACARRLTATFGDEGWRDAFYATAPSPDPAVVGQQETLFVVGSRSATAGEAADLAGVRAS